MSKLLMMGGLLLALIAPIEAQTIAHVSTGALQCGALKRSATTVQTYCYLIGPPGTAPVVVHNTIDTVDGTLEVRFNYGPDVIHWLLTSSEQGISYVVMTGASVQNALVQMVNRLVSLATDRPTVMVYLQPAGGVESPEWIPADITPAGDGLWNIVWPDNWAVAIYAFVSKGVL